MGDPLSIAASITGLISTSAQIVGMTKELFDKTRDVPVSMMRVREEVESMQTIFRQLQLLLNGAVSRPNLIMLSAHNLMATLTGCVSAFGRLEKKLNEVPGLNDPTTASAANRVAWGLWGYEEALVIIEELQRPKLSLTLMLTAFTSATVTEASDHEVQARLQALSTEILQSSHAHSVVLRDLISRQDEQARVLEQIRLYTSTLSGTGSSALLTRSSSAGSFNNSPQLSGLRTTTQEPMYTANTRHTFPDGYSSAVDHRSELPDLEKSRAYGYSSNGEIGDPLSIVAGLIAISARIAGMIKELFDKVKDVPEPMMQVREEVESMQPIFCHIQLLLNGSGSQPNHGSLTMSSVHNLMATLSVFVTIFSRLEEKVNELCGFNTASSTAWKRVITKQAKLGLWRQEEVLGIIRDLQREKLNLNLMLTIITCVETTEAQAKSQELSSGILQSSHAHSALLQDLINRQEEQAQALNAIRSQLSLKGYIHAVIDGKCKTSLDLLLEMGADVREIDVEGSTPLVHAAQLVLTSKIDIAEYKSLDYICRALLENANIETMKKMAVARIASAVSMHYLVEKGYKSILQLLSLMELRDAEGWTPLASAAFNYKEALCEFLVKKSCTLCLNDGQKKQLKSKLSYRIHAATQRGNKTALQLLLDMGADINERDADGGTAILGAVYFNHLSCVKILVERGADATIANSRKRTALHHAVWSQNEQIMKFLLDDIVEIRKLVDVKNSDGDTALHDCSNPSHRSPGVCLEVAKMLVQAGASLTTKDKCGRTPYGRARDTDWGNKEVAKYLWSQLSPEQQAREKSPPSGW